MTTPRDDGNGSAAPGPPSRLQALLVECVRRDASDIHLAPGSPPFLRIHGTLAPLEIAPLSTEDVESVAATLLRFGAAGDLARKGSVDGAVSAEDGTRFRFNVFRRQGKSAIALRRLEDRFQSLGELGLPESLYSLCDLRD